MPTQTPAQMSPPPDGGPAFSEHHHFPLSSSTGMTLRDYFAAHALAGFCATQDADGDVMMGATDTARACYNYADSMLDERSKAK